MSEVGFPYRKPHRDPSCVAEVWADSVLRLLREMADTAEQAIADGDWQDDGGWTRDWIVRARAALNTEAVGEFGNTPTSRLLPNSGQSGVASRKNHDSDTSVDSAQKEGQKGEPTCVHNNPQCRCSQLKRLRIMREGDEPANPGEQIEGAPSS